MAQKPTIDTSVKFHADPKSLDRMRSVIHQKIERKPLNLTLNTKTIGRPLGKISGDVDEFTRSIEASNARTIAFAASASAILVVKKAIEGLAASTINVEKSLKDINVILNASSSSLRKFGGDLFKVANDTAQSFDNVAKAATEFSRQGLGIQETLKRTKDALILTRLSGLDVEASVNALTASINSFNKVALSSTQIINKLANVDAAFAVSSKDLADALSRVGSSAEDAGVSFDSLIALVTSAQQITARGGAVLGNSFKTIFQRIRRPQVLEQLASLDIAVRDLNGELLPADKLLVNVAQKFDGLSNSGKNVVTQLAAGVFQANVFKAILGDLAKGELSQYNNALQVSVDSTDQAIKRNEELNQTLAALIQRTKNAFTQLGANVGKEVFAPQAKESLGLLNRAAGGLNKQLEAEGNNTSKSFLKGLGNFASGPGALVAGGLIGKFGAQFAGFGVNALKTIVQSNSKLSEQKRLQEKIAQVLTTEQKLNEGILSGTIKRSNAQKQVLDGLIKERLEAQKIEAASKRIAQNFAAQGLALNKTGTGLATNAAFNEAAGQEPTKRGFPGGLKGGLITAALTAPILGGVIQEAIPEGNRTGRAFAGGASQLLGSVGAGALIGGPIGVGVAGVGSIFAIVKTFQQLNDITPDLADNLERVREATTRQTEGFAQLLNLLDKASGIDPSDTKNFKTLASTFTEIAQQIKTQNPTEFKNFLGALKTGGITEATEFARNLNISNQRRLSSADLASTLGGLNQGALISRTRVGSSAPSLGFGGIGASFSTKSPKFKTSVSKDGEETIRVLASQILNTQALGGSSIGERIKGNAFKSISKTQGNNFAFSSLLDSNLRKAFNNLQPVVQTALISAILNQQSESSTSELEKILADQFQKEQSNRGSIRSQRAVSSGLLRQTSGLLRSSITGNVGIAEITARRDGISRSTRSRARSLQNTVGREAAQSFTFDQERKLAGLSGEILNEQAVNNLRKSLGAISSILTTFNNSLSETQIEQGQEIIADNNNFLRQVLGSGSSRARTLLKGRIGQAQSRISELEGENLIEGGFKEKELNLLRKELDLLQNTFTTFNSELEIATIKEKEAIKTAEERNDAEMATIRSLREFNRTLALEGIKNRFGQAAGEAQFIQGRAQGGFASSTELADARRSARAAQRRFKGVNGRERQEGLGAIAAFGEELRFSTFDFFEQVEDGAAQTARTMKSEFQGAFKSFIDGSQNAGEAFRSFGLGVANKILDITSSLATNALFNGIFNATGLTNTLSKGLFSSPGFNKGGLVQKFASGGKVKGGSGVKDDVPAVLTGGEFVLNKKAVDRIGSQNLERLNNVESANRILANRFVVDGKRPNNISAGRFDVSSNLSTFGQTESINRQNAVKFQTEQDFFGYIRSAKAFERQKAQAMNQFKRAKKQRLIGNLINAGLIIGGGALQVGRAPAGTTVSGGQSHAPNSFNNSFFNDPQFRNSGGVIRGRTSPGDSVPAMLTGGEFVVNKGVVDRLGLGFFEGLNSNKVSKSQLPRFQSGGDVLGRTAFGQTDNNQPTGQIEDLLNRLIQVNESVKGAIESKKRETSESGSLTTPTINLPISISIEGGNTESSIIDNGSDGGNEDSITRSREFAEKIRGLILQTIQEEKQPQGLLSNI